MVFFLSKLGNCTDFLLAKGDLSPNNVKLFNEVARSLGIADREIKAKNSGFLMRFFTGYNNALAVQLFNRTYFNDSELNKMSEEEKRFVMGHELTHHAKNHAWKKRGVVWMLSVASAVCKKLVEPDSISIKKDSILRRYFLNGWDVFGMATISFWGLLQGQYCQAQEREADQGAVLDAGAHPVDGKKFLHRLYSPDTSDWPLYARLIDVMSLPFVYVLSLPILKQHASHLISLDDRTSDVIALTDQWNQKYKQNKTASEPVLDVDECLIQNAPEVDDEPVKEEN